MGFDPNMAQAANPGMGQQPQPSGGQPQGDPSQLNQGQMLTGQPQPGDPAPQQSEGGDPSSAVRAHLNAMIEEKNLAEKIKDEKLEEIGRCVVEGYEKDRISCTDWLDNNEKWLKLTLLTSELKTYPWPGASNVKYPLLATACMQFSARAYPTLVPDDNNIVKSRVIGYDPDGSRADKADRISKHMSFQIMHRMPNWEEDMDRLLLITAASGTCYKKTYKDVTLGTIVSKIVYPANLIINYWDRTVEGAYRKTELILLNKNKIEEKMRSGEFVDFIIPSPNVSTATSVPQEQQPKANESTPPDSSDELTPHLFLEQHTYYDLDEDGYAEPVVITVHKDTKKVVRITARFASDSFKFDKNKKISRIEPIEYYTAFNFLPNPDGSLLGIGFGSLLGPINQAIDSLCNQLVDSGTLNNLQSGYIAKGLRIQMKETKFVPGEWKPVNATGENLKDSIFPLPTKEPSSVLFQLMNLLITSGNQLASVAEIFVGKMPGQNTPASTTQTTVDQAMKVFTAIYKRLYRSLLLEFQKIYRLNSMSEDILQDEGKILNIPLTVSDYDDSIHDIIPAADPSGNSAQNQAMQLQQVGQSLIPTNVINLQEFALRSLKLMHISDPEKLINPPQPTPPDPKVQTEQMKQQTLQMKGQQDSQKAQQDMQMKQQDAQLKQQIAQMDMQMKAMELKFKEQEMQLESAAQKQDLMFQQVSAMQDQRAQQSQHELDLRTAGALSDQKVTQSQEAHEVKLQQMKQTQAAKPKTNGKGV